MHFLKKLLSNVWNRRGRIFLSLFATALVFIGSYLITALGVLIENLNEIIEMTRNFQEEHLFVLLGLSVLFSGIMYLVSTTLYTDSNQKILICCTSFVIFGFSLFFIVSPIMMIMENKENFLNQLFLLYSQNSKIFNVVFIATFLSSYYCLGFSTKKRH